MRNLAWTTVVGLLALAGTLGCNEEETASSDRSRLQEQHLKAKARKAEASKRDHARRAQALARRLDAAKRRAPTIGPLKKVQAGDPAKIVASAVERRGGLARLKAVKAVGAEHHLRGPVLGAKRRRLVWQLPDKMKLDFVGKLDEVRRGLLVDGRRGVAYSRSGLRKLSAKEVEMYRHALLTDPTFTLVAASRPGAKLLYLGQASVGKRPAHVVRFSRRGRVVQLYIAADGELLAYRYNGHQGLTTVLHSNFKVTSGIRLSASNTMIVRGVRIAIEVSKLRINPKLPAGTFDLTKNPLQSR